MKMKFSLAAAFLTFALLLAISAFAGTGSKDSPAPAAAPSATSSSQDEDMRMEGEKRFRSNCGRCHMAPPKFGPRMVATIVRHMRVRANITDEDRRLIIHYMAQ